MPGTTPAPATRPIASSTTPRSTATARSTSPRRLTSTPSSISPVRLWSYLVKAGAITDPRSFIHPVPHMSFVHGAENVAFLRKRFAAMSAHPC